MTVTDPIQWMKNMLEYPTVLLTNAEIADGNAILRAAERQRIGSLSLGQLAAELGGTPSPELIAEAARRLSAAPAPTPQPASAAKVSETSHACTSPDFPEGIPCFCVHGVDHDESLFDVPRE